MGQSSSIPSMPNFSTGVDIDEDEGAMFGPIVAGTAPISPGGSIVRPTVAGELIWLQPSTLSAYADLAPVDQWNCSCAVPHHGIGTAAGRPIYHATGGPNNSPYITLDGIDDFLAFTAVAGQIDEHVNATFLIVCKSSNTNATCLFQTRSTNVKCIRQGTVAGKFEAYSDPTGTVIGDISTTNWQIIKTQLLATHSFQWKLGAASFFWGGHVAELLVYGPGVSVGDYNLLAAYLAAKYGL